MKKWDYDKPIEEMSRAEIELQGVGFFFIVSPKAPSVKPVAPICAVCYHPNKNERRRACASHAAARRISGLLTKCLFIYSERKKGSKKDAHRRHPMYFIILFKFKAVAERRQWSSAASKPRRKTRVKLCPHF